MNKAKQLISVVFFLICGSSVAAEYDPIKIGFGYGQGSFEVPVSYLPDDGSFLESTNEDSEDAIYYFSILTKPMNNLGFEFSYYDLGELSSSNVSDGSSFWYSAGDVKQSSSFKGMGLSAVFDYMPRPRFSIFGKLGVYQLDVTSSGNFNDSSEHTGTIIGYGFEAMLNQSHSVKLEFIKFRDVRGVSNVFGGGGRVDIDTVSIVYLYSF